MSQELLLAESQYGNINIDIKEPTIVFLYGTLGMGKTSFVRAQLQQLGITSDITSPTYTYYNKYGANYHFDLYRLESYDEFINIGGEEILDNNEGVIFIEWPEILEKYYKPDIKITIHEGENNQNRIVKIEESKTNSKKELD